MVWEGVKGQEIFRIWKEISQFFIFYWETRGSPPDSVSGRFIWMLSKLPTVQKSIPEYYRGSRGDHLERPKNKRRKDSLNLQRNCRKYWKKPVGYFGKLQEFKIYWVQREVMLMNHACRGHFLSDLFNVYISCIFLSFIIYSFIMRRAKWKQMVM